MLSLLLRLHNWGRLWGCQSRNRTCPHRLTVLYIVLTGEGCGRENSALSELVPATAQGWGRIPVCPVVVRLGEMLHQWRAQLLLEKRSCASPWGRSRQGPRSGDSRPSTKVGSFLVGFFFLVSGGGCCYSAVVLIVLVLLLAEGIGLGWRWSAAAGLQ